MENREYIKPVVEIVIFNVEDEITIIEGNTSVTGKEEGWV